MTTRDATIPGARPEDGGSRLLRAIVETLLSDAPVAPAPALRRVATDEAAAFVAAQLRALAPGLRWRLAAGLAGFRIYVRLVAGRAFERLPEDARRRLVDRWSYGAATAPRQLFRLLRSLTLLAYFESEAVRAVLARDTSIPAIPVSPPSGPR
ncbi:MAG: gluconate 2-dehydrogenase subunit 3 family protein [Burkholderiales bacterium]|nr:gluconate 2-dehydrogenase subunit 3 family protein [Burkholderiales bacterium]MCC7115995.1 gluconate 2-dehydrogenase subunit 3 family protein [Burkholderiales bacterium]